MRDTELRSSGREREDRLEPWRVIAIIVVFACFVALAFLVSGYHLFQLTMVASYACAILGLVLLTGINGQISLGHGAFYAVGAYSTAILMANYDWPYWATLPVGAIAAGVIGFLVGFPALRLSGLYLALVTLALAVAVPQLLKVNSLADLTGGVQGLTTDKPSAPFGLPISDDQWIYLFSLGITALVFLVGWNLERGRIGRAMKAIRDQPLAAESMGVNISSVKTRTFAVSAAFTGIAGCLTTFAVQFVAPDSFNSFISIWFFVGLVVGGVNSILGAILGAAFIEYVPNIANDISKAAPGAIYGVILMGFMYLMPLGVAGTAYQLLRRLRGARRQSLSRAAAAQVR
ncbi:MAG TPA: branched-chain amino acid ABC transporter permease [Acetobacteraceae bacterium]|nr:branched-chain amino acid ABC transporter permease [Acetobacteraceae bacterium]